MARKSLITGEIVRPPPPPCCHDGCHLHAACRIKTATGWANVCWDHYDLHFRNEARTWCLERGLDSREKQRAFIKKTLRSPTFMKPRPREPGDDDEMVA